MKELTVDDLLKVLQEWDSFLTKQISLFACGGTAITIYGHKESTKDVDLLIPNSTYSEETRSFKQSF